MPPQSKTSRGPADLLRGWAATIRSDASSHQRHRRPAATNPHPPGQGTQGTFGPGFASPAGSTPPVLETQQAPRLPVPGQAPVQSAFTGHDSKGLQACGRQGGHHQTGRDPAHAAAHLGHGDARSGSRLADHQQAAGAFELRHHDGLSARSPATLRPQPQSAGLAADSPMPAVGRSTDAKTKRLPRVIDALREFTPKFMRWARPHPQVKSVLSKILLCRTAALKGHLYRCTGCQSEVNVYNSCTDRHCPQCSGAQRANWMDKSAEVVLPGVPYFQVIFTMPDKLSALILGNRDTLYSLLFHSAWKALNSQLRETAGFEAAALMVLHTWNQRLEHHPHLHVLVPAAGPSIEGDQWTVARHPTHRRRKKPYLTDVHKLGQAFREHYVRGLRRLFKKGELKIGGSVDFLNDPAQRELFLEALESIDWNVFAEGPPAGKSNPTNVLKYLARYLGGGPIADRRLISVDKDEVHFWARPKKSAHKHKGMNRPERFRLSARQFMQRWSMHILPKGFTRSRCYGGYHGSKREQYLQLSRQLLAAAGQTIPEPAPEPVEEADVDVSATQPKCRRCDCEMTLVHSQRKPSWRTIFERDIFRSNDYSPQFHRGGGRSPPGGKQGK